MMSPNASVGSSKYTNQWDILASRFNTHTDFMHPDVAVNVEVGWPVIDKIIDEVADKLGRRLSILDFGCGAGGLCQHLAPRGHSLTGIDTSFLMIKLANEHNSRNNVNFIYVRDTTKFLSRPELKGRWDIVIAIHSFEWIENIREVFVSLNNVIKKGGLLVFGVFPVEHVIDSILIKDLFEDFDSKINPRFGYANFDGVRVPVWIRTVSDYDNMLSDLGFTRCIFELPDYPPYFFEKYKWSGSRYPEMMILGYKKDN